MPYVFTKPTIIDFAEHGCGFFGSSAMGDPFEYTTGNLTLKGFMPDTHRKVGKFILDHMLLWEWEEAPFAHRLSGTIWVALCLGCTGVDWAAAKWYYSGIGIYLRVVWDEFNALGSTSPVPLKENKPFDPTILCEIRIEVTGSVLFESKLPIADLNRFIESVARQRNQDSPTRWNNIFRGWATLHRWLLEDRNWHNYTQLQRQYQRPRGGPFILFRTEITAWVRAWSLHIGGYFGILNFTMSKETPLEATVSITEG